MSTMSSDVRTYDPKEVTFVFNGVAITGYMDGTFISIEPEGQAFEKHRGADGSIDRVNRNAYSYTITITLKQTAPANVVLAGMKYADQQTNAGAGGLSISDLNGTSVFNAPVAWISQEPTVEYGDSMSGREWQFETGIAVNTPGGNNNALG